MKRIAGIDIGTNTVLLFIGAYVQGRLVPVYEAMRFARLGEGVEASGRLTEAAMERVQRILLEYRAIARTYGVDTIVAGATSATRDAANREAFLNRLEATTGIRPEVLSGAEEAVWSFRGALAHPELEALEGPVQVMDIGGGSTEFVWGYRRHPLWEARVESKTSLNIGAVRLRERFFPEVPPPSEAWAEARVHVERELHRLLPEPLEGATCVGAASTIAALWLLESNHPIEDPCRFPVGKLAYACVRKWLERLRVLSPEEVLALRPEVMRGREDVFAAGVLILERWLALSGKPYCLVSPWGLRQGLVLRALAEGVTPAAEGGMTDMEAQPPVGRSAPGPDRHPEENP